MARHLPVPGDHSTCAHGRCSVTGRLCCGGHDTGVCGECDQDRADQYRDLVEWEANTYDLPPDERFYRPTNH